VLVRAHMFSREIAFAEWTIDSAGQLQKGVVVSCVPNLETCVDARVALSWFVPALRT